MLPTPNQQVQEKIGELHHPTDGKYASYRIDNEIGWGGVAKYKITVTYRNREIGGERRLAGGFQSIEHAERYIARFLPEFLRCVPAECQPRRDA